MRTACQIGIVTHFTSCVAQVQDEALCVVHNSSHHRAACRALHLWWAAHLHLALALLPPPWHDLPQLLLTSSRAILNPATIYKRWVSAIWLIPPPLHFWTTQNTLSHAFSHARSLSGSVVRLSSIIHIPCTCMAQDEAVRISTTVHSYITPELTSTFSPCTRTLSYPSARPTSTSPIVNSREINPCHVPQQARIG